MIGGYSDRMMGPWMAYFYVVLYNPLIVSMAILYANCVCDTSEKGNWIQCMYDGDIS